MTVSGWVAWGYLSMMEIWLYGTVLMATVFLLSRASTSGGWAWPMAMLAAAGLAFARPEGMLTGLAVALIGLVVWARGRGRPREGRPPIGHPAWALLPVMGAAAFFFLNWIGSGTFSTNGFEAKSVLSDPYASTFEKAGQVGQNFVQGGQTLFQNFGPEPLGALAFALVVVGAAARLPHEWQRNEIGVGTAAAVMVLVGLAAASTSDLAVSHNTRYLIALAPLVSLLTVLGLWELSSLLRAQKSTKVVAAGILIIIVLPGVLSWASRFGENSGEVYLQQREVGIWLRDNTPEDALIAVNDAGAIAYYSGRRVYDLVGLVTNGQARAFRHGQGSVYEAIERLSPEERPDYFAVYPRWIHFVGEATEFEQLYAARLEARRIAGGDTAVVYAARYGAVGPGEAPADTGGRQIVDEVDVADLVSEDGHGYEARGRQTGIRFSSPQVVRSAVLPGGGASVLDGGRVVSRVERFELTAEPNTDLALGARLGFSALEYASPQQFAQWLAVGASVKVNGEDVGAFSPRSSALVWGEQEVAIPARLNPTGHLLVEVSVESPWQYESYHYWLLD